MIGITTAHWAELTAVGRLLQEPRRRPGCVEGFLQGVPVVVMIIGQGPARAARRWQAIRRTAPSCDAWLFAGFAGGTAPGFQVGDCVIPDRVLDCIEQPDPLSARGFVPSIPTYVVRRIVSGATRPGSPARGGVLGTFSRVVPSVWEKTRLGQIGGLVAVDMESAALAEAADRAKVPWLVARTILDPMEHPLLVHSVWHATGLGLSVVGWGRLRAFATELRQAQHQLGGHVQNVVIGMHRIMTGKVRNDGTRTAVSVG